MTVAVVYFPLNKLLNSVYYYFVEDISLNIINRLTVLLLHNYLVRFWYQ